jgi:hypothetical protein
VGGPDGRASRWQRWAAKWLKGRRLGTGLPDVDQLAAAGLLEKPGAGAFHRWLKDRLPAALPLP